MADSTTDGKNKPLIEYLFATGEILTPVDIVEATGHYPTLVFRCLRALIDNGTVHCVGLKGLYRAYQRKESANE